MLCATLCAVALSAAPAGSAEPVSIAVSPIETFKGARWGERVDGVVWRGGFVMSADHPGFGEISGLSFIDHTRFVMVTDRGFFLSGALHYDPDGPSRGFSGTVIERMRNASGAPLTDPFEYDAEAVEIIFRDDMAAAVRVGFEKNTRVADYDLVEGRPTGNARPVAIPDWLGALRHNQTIESLCIAPPASPIAGSTLIVTEGHTVVPGTWAGTLLGVEDRGDLSLAQSGSFRPTDCAFLPDGDLLVLERAVGITGFSMQIRHIRAATVSPGATLDGPVIVSGSGRAVDNMEALGVRIGPEGETRLVVVSDDNFHTFQRNMLLEFALP